MLRRGLSASNPGPPRVRLGPRFFVAGCVRRRVELRRHSVCSCTVVRVALRDSRALGRWNASRREVELLRRHVVAASSLDAARALLQESLTHDSIKPEAGVDLIYCCRFTRLFDDALALSREYLGYRQPKHDASSRWPSWSWARNIAADRDDYLRTQDSLQQGHETRFEAPSAKLRYQDAFYADSAMHAHRDRRPTQLVLDQSGITLLGRHQEQRLQWTDITDATLTLRPAKARDTIWQSTHYVSRWQTLDAHPEDRERAEPTSLDLSWYNPRFRHPDLLEGEIKRRASAWRQRRAADVE